jgi:cell division septum initiation protein DivIVA
MIEKLISDLEAKIQTVSGPSKGELLQLLAKLRAEISALEKTSDDVREKQKELKSSVEELQSSVEGFEQSHPKLVQAVNSISNTLSNWGI